MLTRGEALTLLSALTGTLGEKPRGCGAGTAAGSGRSGVGGAAALSCTDDALSAACTDAEAGEGAAAPSSCAQRKAERVASALAASRCAALRCARAAHARAAVRYPRSRRGAMRRVMRRSQRCELRRGHARVALRGSSCRAYRGASHAPSRRRRCRRARGPHSAGPWRVEAARRGQARGVDAGSRRRGRLATRRGAERARQPQLQRSGARRAREQREEGGER